MLPISSPSLRILTLLLLLAGWGRLPLEAAESLARFAPAETALYVEVPALESTWQTYDDSPLAARWKQTRLAGLWLKSPFVERWRALDAYATAKSGQTLTHHLRRLFADGVAVAVVLHDHHPAGVLVAQAMSPQHVSEALRVWDKLEPPVRTEPRTAAGRPYFARVIKKSGGEQLIYYAVDGPRFMLSDQEGVLRECLRLWPANGSPAEPDVASLADQPEFAELRPAAAPAAFLYVAPQRWLPVLKSLSDDKPPSQLILAGMARLRGVLANVVIEQGAELEVTATLVPEALTTDWRDFVAASRPAPSIIESAPADALVVAGGRFEARPLIAGFTQLMTEQDRREMQKGGAVLQTLLLGVDPWSKALPALLSDWGGYITLRPVTDQVPPRNHPFVAVIQANLPTTARDPNVALGWENALTFGINALATAMMVEKDGTPIVLQHLQEGGTQEWRIQGRPAGEIALRISPEAVTFSTSVIELQQTATASANGGRDTPLAAAARDRFPHAAAFVWLQTRRFRSSPAPLVIQAIAGGKEPTPLAVLNELSQLFDEVFAALTLDEQRLGLRTGGRVTTGP